MLTFHALTYIVRCNQTNEHIWIFATAYRNVHKSNSTKKECTPMQVSLSTRS